MILLNYKRILECFGLISGLQINYDKSTIIPLNCMEEMVDNFKGIFGCGIAALHIKYLGRNWVEILEKWKCGDPSLTK